MDARMTFRELPRGRQTTVVVLAIAAAPLTFLSIFDPLEGGMALLATFALNRLIRWLSTMPAPRLYLWSFVAAVVVGGVALGMAIAQGEKDGMSDLVRVLAYAYSAITLFVTAGAALYARDILAAYRSGTAA
jgi:hypothetical protein